MPCQADKSKGFAWGLQGSKVFKLLTLVSRRLMYFFLHVSQGNLKLP